MGELLRRLTIKPGLSAELVAASFFANILALAAPLYVIQVLNRYVAHGIDATLATLSAGAVVAIMLEFGFRQVRTRLARGISATPDDQAAAAGFTMLTTAKAATLERILPGQRREIMNGAANIQSAYSAANISAVLDVPFAVLFLGVLFLLKPALAAVAALFVAAAFLISLALMTSLRAPASEMGGRTRGAGIMVSTAAQEIDTVRAFNAAGFLRGAWQAQTRGAQALYRKISARQGLLMSLNMSTAALMNITLMAMGGYFVVRGEFNVGALIGANLLATRALQPITRFAQMGESFVKARHSLELLREFARLPREAETGSGRREYKGALELRDLAFTHPQDNTPLFESLSLSLPAGATLVVSGGNGTGKTTLARLLVGLLEPSRGQILADGLDLHQVLPEWWRQQLIYLPQEPALLTATIGDNLRVLNPEIGDTALNAIIDAVGLRKYLDESDKGFETPIFENGRHLSLGIRRRMALARALAGDGKVAILDEPTEGFDAEGRAAVYALMNDLHKRGRTIIAFSHDPNILKGAQFVVDLNSKPVPRIMTVPRPVESDAAGTGAGENKNEAAT